MNKTEWQSAKVKKMFQNALREADCEVTFEKMDGTIRVMRCTLRPEVLPELKGSNVKKPDEILPVWDLENEGWRCFDIWTVQKFVKDDEIIYENCNI